MEIRSLTPAMAKSDAVFAALYVAYLADFGVDCDYSRYGAVLEELLTQNWIAGLTACSESAMQGFCIYSRTYSALAAAPAFLVEDLYIDAPCRRRRIGLSLLEELTRQARTAGVRRIFVQTDLDDPAMTGFYAGVGFVDADASLLRLEVS